MLLPGEQCGAHLVYRPQEEVQEKDFDFSSLGLWDLEV